MVTEFASLDDTLAQLGCCYCCERHTLYWKKKNLSRLNCIVLIFIVWCYIRKESLDTTTLLVHLNSLRLSDAYICVRELNIIGSGNGLSPGRRRASIWTSAGILSTWPSGTNFIEMSIEIHTFSLKKMHLKLSSGKGRPFCLGLNVLKLVRHWWLL